MSMVAMNNVGCIGALTIPDGAAVREKGELDYTSGDTPCNIAALKTAWYKIAVGSMSGILRASLVESGTDTIDAYTLSLSDGCPGSCLYTTETGWPTINYSVPAGSQFYIIVESTVALPGRFMLSVYITPSFQAPINNVCAQAEDITSAEGAFYDYVPALVATSICSLSNNFYYKLVPTVGYDVVVATLRDASFNARLLLYDGCSGSFCTTTQDACNTDLQLSAPGEGSPEIIIGVFGNFPTFGGGTFFLDYYFYLSDRPVNTNPQTTTIITNSIYSFDITYVSLSTSCPPRSSRSTWYTFPSDLNTYVIVSTCPSLDGYAPFPVFFSLSTDQCTSLQTSINSCTSDCASAGQTYSAPISTGTMYYLELGTTASNVYGNVTFAFTQGYPSNDLCSDAIPLQALRGTIYVFLSGALYDDINGDCMGLNNPNVWYSFSIVGSEVSAFLDSLVYSWDTSYTLYKGDCATNTCVFTTTRSVSTVLLPGNYLLEVQNLNEYDIFAFKIEAVDSYFPANDHCDSAENVNIDYLRANRIIYGSTVNAVLDTGVSYCNVLTSHTVWYKFNSDQYNYMTMQSVDSFGAANQFSLSLYSGPCSTHNCIASSSNGAYLRSTLTFMTDYYISVSACEGCTQRAFELQGTFGIYYSADYSTCFTPFNLVLDPLPSYFTNELNTLEAWSCGMDSFAAARKVWFTFTPADGDEFISTDPVNSASLLEMNTRVSIYTNCGITCLAEVPTLTSYYGPYETSTVNYRPSAAYVNTVHYMTVIGLFPYSTGKFNLVYHETPRGTNDECIAAEPIAGTSLNVYGTVYQNPVSPTINCGKSSFGTAGAYYSFNSGGFTQLEVRKIFSYGEIYFLLFKKQCNYPKRCFYDSTHLSLLLYVEPNTEYYLVVSATEYGSFGFRFDLTYGTERAGLSCPNPLSITEASGHLVDGFANQRYLFTSNCLDFGFNQAGSMWYTFNSGAYNYVTISMCFGGSAAANTAFQLLTPLQNVCALGCVTGNADSCGMDPQIISAIDMFTDYTLYVAYDKIG